MANAFDVCIRFFQMFISSSKLLQSSEELFRKIKPEKLKRGKE